ncbi:hypothetical protein D3C72_733320 [compost metagenome]
MKYYYLLFLFSTVLISSCEHSHSKSKAINDKAKGKIGSKEVSVNYIRPSDDQFNELNEDVSYDYGDKGNTALIINVEAPQWGYFKFVFKEKIIKEEHFGGDSTDVYEKQENGEYGVVRKDFNEPYQLTVKNLFAYVLLEDHGGYVEKCKFQDFGNEVYWPEFQYDYCAAADEDNDGKPEFYLVYYGESDGLDAKPLKVIVYDKDFDKYKATAYFPSGNKDDKYHVEYSENWKKLPKAVQLKGNSILKKFKESKR